MKRILISLVLITLTIFQSARADLRVFACEPEWGALVQELAGDKADVFVATTALQDPHHIQARPSLIAKVRRADLVVCTGAGLEVGWLPLLLRRSANGRIQPGQPGYFEASAWVILLDKPVRLDRAEGDIHPEGNPHIQTDPRNILTVARALAPVLAQLDPENAGHYKQRLDDFQQRWQAAMARWNEKAAPLRGTPVVLHHKGWAYLVNWLGLKVVGTLEPKPGIPPSTAHLQALLQRLQFQPAKLIIHAAYQDPRPDEWLSQHAHIPAVTLPFTVGGTPGAKDLFGLFDDTLERLLKAVESTS